MQSCSKMASEKFRKDGNERFMKGKYLEAIEFYTKALESDPGSHLALSNRSLTYSKLNNYDQALQDAERCVEISERWGKGYLRKATALNLLQRHEEAKKAVVSGFGYSLGDNRLATGLVTEWLVASKALTMPKHAQKLKQLGEAIPECSELFCDEYCEILFTIVWLRLSDSDSMSHDQMVACINGVVRIADKVLADFCQPSSTAFQDWAEAATIQCESYPQSEWTNLMQGLQQKTAKFTKWLREEVHPSLRQVLNPVIILVVSAILVRCNILCQAYAGHNAAEYLGYACSSLFDGVLFTDPIYIPFHMAALNLVLSIYRTKGEPLSDEQVELMRGICHKIDSLLQKLPASHKNYDAIKEHYEQAVKVSREICAKVISGFTGSHDPNSALSELEITLLECDSNPDGAEEIALKYLADIAQKTERSESSSISHINFIDAENMLYLTGIFAKLNKFDYAQRMFTNGENMLLSLIATVASKRVLTLDQLPSAVTNGRQFVLSGAIWLKGEFPEVAADAFIRWKSFFTELRAILIQLGLGNAYRAAFLSLERLAPEGTSHQKLQALEEFKVAEGQVLQKFILPVINAMYQQKAKTVAGNLEETDVVLDYTFNIYNPQYSNPPQSQAFGMALQSCRKPLLFSVDNQKVYELLTKLPEATYKMWLSDAGTFGQVTKALSDLLFPPEIQKLLLDSKVKTLFISPDVDLMCFPIDQLPLSDADGTVQPLYKRFSVTVVSSPRELIRKQTVASLCQASELAKSNDQPSNDSALPSSEVAAEQMAQQMSALDISKQSSNESSSQPTDVGSDTDAKGHPHVTSAASTPAECFIVADPDFKHELSSESGITSSLKNLLSYLDAFLGPVTQSGDDIPELQASRTEADNVQQSLSINQKLMVHKPIVGSEATMSKLLSLDSPFVLHCATHGYAGKQVSTRYRGNFWTDNSSGILLSGAMTFRKGKYSKMDPEAGTGHMNAIAACGLRLSGTRLVFISACNSSVGSRPTQEMANSFTQALRAAGADTVISTLWTVTDNNAAEFASYFYDCLVNKPHCRPSEAVSYAKQKMESEGKSMFYWGAYVCNGVDIALFP